MIDRREGSMQVDPLSDVLGAIGLTGAVFFDFACWSPWAAEQPEPHLIAPLVQPGAQRLISFHIIAEGRCFAGRVGETPLLLGADDVIVFTRGDAHVLASDPGLRAEFVSTERYEEAARARRPFSLRLGDEGTPSARVVCGFLAYRDQSFNPLLDHLPPIIKRDGGAGAPAIGQLIRLAVSECRASRQGSQPVLARLSELLFIEVVRQHVESRPAEQAGWLNGLNDPVVGRALGLMHGDIARAWTLEALAREAAASRSVLAERFAQMIGMPPIEYLTRWRMQVASGKLRNGQASIANVAADVGYGSEAAFSRAFKKVVGVPPSSVRRRGPDGEALGPG